MSLHPRNLLRPVPIVHPTAVELRANSGTNNVRFLRRIVALERGIPSHDTLSQLFRQLDPEAFDAHWASRAPGCVRGDQWLSQASTRSSFSETQCLA